MKTRSGRFGSAVGRWASFGPYYAIFPIEFAWEVVEAMLSKGGRVLDPFCGRGTVPFVAQVTGRPSLGIDLNPVAWVFAKVKTDPERNVENLLRKLDDVQKEIQSEDCIAANEFQKWAWSSEVLDFLNAARRELAWRENKTDRTLMGIILASLHARHSGLSNQMQSSRSMGPKYAVRWWQNRSMKPPAVNPTELIQKKIDWRYKYGIVDCKKKSVIKLGDSAEILSSRSDLRFNLLFTSPPYCTVTDYRQDNWIRLWMLQEGDALPDWKKDERMSRHQAYKKMIDTVLANAGRQLTPRGVVWIRTDAREFTKNVTLDAMRRIWPNRKLYLRADKPKYGTQTDHFRNLSKGTGEIDLLIPGRRPLPFDTSAWTQL